MRIKHALSNARSASDVDQAVTAARKAGWTPTQIERHGSKQVLRTLALKLTPAPQVGAGRALSARAKTRLAEAAKWPIGTRTGSRISQVLDNGLLTEERNARVEVERHGPEGGLILAIEAPGASGYARLSPGAFGELATKGGVFTVYLCADRDCKQAIGEYKLVKSVR